MPLLPKIVCPERLQIAPQKIAEGPIFFARGANLGRPRPPEIFAGGAETVCRGPQRQLQVGPKSAPSSAPGLARLVMVLTHLALARLAAKLGNETAPGPHHRPGGANRGPGTPPTQTCPPPHNGRQSDWGRRLARHQACPKPSRRVFRTEESTFCAESVYHRPGALPPDPRRGETPRTPPWCLCVRGRAVDCIFGPTL